ncbi:choice-of-anchor B family protein [Crocinitomicaceae bacterium]|nr:choice-of-anchor B family protein [Crocinitomicaceae bacterium]MDB4606464.1 choice-of-anchor B family protein [Crocinitomicaceae bacterium]
MIHWRSFNFTYPVLTTLFFGVLLHYNQSFGQADLSFVSQTDYVALHNTGLNDVWGYVDEQGNEYAIVGTEDGTSIMNVTDPSSPFEVFWLAGENSTWRDPSVYGDYAYISTEAEEGLTIINMSPLPESNVLIANLFTGDESLSWQSAHNCHVDENGLLYVFGANYGEGGVLIYDVSSMPMNPTFVGAFDNWYVHDGVAFGDTLYLAHVNDGFLSIVDITDPSSPQLMGTKTTVDSFTHNIWPSDDRQVVYTTDEVPDAFVASYDISDVNNIIELDRVQSSPGENVIPHNTFVLNDYLVTSYYADGITIHDAKYPNNLIELVTYDTYPEQTPTYDGSWGVYPFLPSGNILASDRTEGLFVLQPEYQRAAYLEGNITNQLSSNPIDNVLVTIPENTQEERSNSMGDYATGFASSGDFEVTYFKVGYESQTLDVNLLQNSVTIQDVEMIPIEPFIVNVIVEDNSGNPIQNANIKLVHPLITYEGESNGLGQETLPLFYEDLHEVYVGKWGYITYCDDLELDSGTGTLTIVLQEGYYDDFTFDFDWSISGDVSTGLWERGIPNPTDNTVMDGDFNSDCGSFAYVTGNAENIDADFDDVDDGVTTLTSPLMNLSVLYENPVILFYMDFYCNHGPGAIDDTLKITLSDGSNQIIRAIPPQNDEMSWGLEVIDPTGLDLSNIIVSFQVSDMEGNPNVTEAAIDMFMVDEYSSVFEDVFEQKVVIYPNPTQSFVTLRGYEDGEYYTLTNVAGMELEHGSLFGEASIIELQNYGSGIYFITIGANQLKFTKL